MRVTCIIELTGCIKLPIMPFPLCLRTRTSGVRDGEGDEDVPCVSSPAYISPDQDGTWLPVPISSGVVHPSTHILSPPLHQVSLLRRVPPRGELPPMPHSPPTCRPLIRRNSRLRPRASGISS